ncbi:MAG: hypothetical protein AAB638_03715 [Patescibacteria group bacterium]
MTDIQSPNINPENMASAGGNSKFAIIIVVAIAVLIAGGFWWYLKRAEYSALTASPSLTPRFDKDTQADISDINSADSADLDMEFKSIDEDLNKL